MKKNPLLKSGITLLILAASSIGPASAGSSEGSLYTDLQTLTQPTQWTNTAVRGAEGPIRSGNMQPATNDIHESISKYQAAPQGEMNSSKRDPQDPMRSAPPVCKYREFTRDRH